MRYSCLNDQSIKVSYFDPISTFDSVQSEINQILPLKDLHWKPQGDTPVVTVKSLKVEFLPETSFADSKILNDVPFIKYIVVKCTSIDEYRSKIRPLIRQWVSTQVQENDEKDHNDPLVHIHKGILLLGSDIHDSKLFKTISLPEKISNDFPALPLYQLHTVYKSQTDRANHWNKYSSSLKKIILEVFEKRVSSLENANIQSPTFETHQQLLQLYLNFKIYGKANLHMRKIESLLTLESKPAGDLSLPIINSKDAGLAEWSSFTVFSALRYRLFSRLSVIECLHPNILADKIKELYRIIVIDFLYEIKSRFQSNELLHQVIYHACDEILDLRLLPALPLKHDESNHSLWKEMYGDILQIKRDSWMELADFHQSGITFCISPSAIPWKIDDVTKTTIESVDNAFQHFVRLTSEIIELFRETRGRTVDLLSMEIANIFYQTRSYEKTMKLLQSSHEYYRNAGWNLIASDVLVQYVTCLEKLEAKTVSIEEEDVPTISVLANSYLNLVTTPQGTDKITWWNKFLALNENAQLVYSLDLLMTTEVDEKVCLSASNTYAIILNILDMKVMTDVSIRSVKLLTKKKGKDQFVVFQKELFELATQSETKLELETTHIAYGEFELISLELVIGNTVFSKEYDEYKKILIHPLYSVNNFHVVLKEPCERNLEKNELELKTVNAERVENFECKIEILEPFSVDFAETNSKNFIVNSANFKSRIQYICKEEQSLELHVLQTLTFKRDGVLYSEVQIVKIDHQIEMSISVNDIYKSDAFYFNFTISAKYEPLHVVDTKLCCNVESKYEITEGYEAGDASSFLEVPEVENLQSFFQIKPIQKAFSYKDCFSLSVSYVSLSGMVNDYLTQKFFGRDSNFSHLKHIWESQILTQIEYHKSQFFNYNTIKISNYDRPQFEKQMQKIFPNESSIDYMLNLYETLFDGLEVEEDFNFSKRKAQALKKLTLSVTIPPPINNVVFSIEMTLDETYTGKTLIVGEPYSCTLKICKQFQAWGGLKLENNSSIYQCELDKGAGSEEWLVSGLKKFEIRNDMTTVNVTLIPIKRGYLRFPDISISPSESLNNTNANASTASLNHTAEVSKIETEFLNINDNIIVV
ncbi:Trafficking protein particle complex II-specific subunit [Hanseniaspora osmophila]|uniref:Trafficking protein particle complex II-specific subunit n=1 Tax=Hanseniaspora osmophila TaxID=56408 RepID=A0A1E5R8D8_9ASCO|nr:Trafficking protein particle complex II-specific subunit [Hanseniaspora osmophila]